MKNPKAKTSRLFRLVSGLLAFILWGGWAYYVNGGHASEIRTVSALAQGSASFIITLIMVRIVTFFYHKFSGANKQIFLSAFLTLILTGSGLIIVHYIVSTPEILKTISPALTVAFLFNIFTAWKIKQSEKN